MNQIDHGPNQTPRMSRRLILLLIGVSAALVLITLALPTPPDGRDAAGGRLD